ncbi:MAG: hypothetical protein HY321_00860 [Armatimonadetes bacterium]|nr:hypothetical protein [Armatimonadota bacterium]
MAKYEIEIDDSYVDALNTLARASHESVSDWVRHVVLSALEAHRSEVSAEFRRLADELVTENEPVLRRVAQ